MAIPVYSTKLYSRASFSGNDQFTCAAGFVTVIREVLIHHPAASATGNAQVANNEGAYIALSGFTNGAGYLYVQPLRTVCNPGDVIHINLGFVGDVSISGYQLALP